MCDAFEPPPTPPPPPGARARASATRATEAPRGILYVALETDAAGDVRELRIVPPTSQNQAQIEADLRALAPRVARAPRGRRRAALCEAAIRDYDPCISCATHFLRLTVERREAAREDPRDRRRHARAATTRPVSPSPSCSRRARCPPASSVAPLRAPAAGSPRRPRRRRRRAAGRRGPHGRAPGAVRRLAPRRARARRARRRPTASASRRPWRSPRRSAGRRRGSRCVAVEIADPRGPRRLSPAVARRRSPRRARVALAIAREIAGLRRGGLERCMKRSSASSLLALAERPGGARPAPAASSPCELAVGEWAGRGARGARRGLPALRRGHPGGRRGAAPASACPGRDLVLRSLEVV